ncbi:MAG TPA: hypothetical protein VMW83_04940 [Spirochaetia bacterium]|nr:hypothetical protein [Spirochaetia bacterium]
MLRNHIISAIWIGIVAAVWVVGSKYIGIPDAWPGFLVSSMVMIEGPKWEVWAKAQFSVLIGLGLAMILVPWIMAWVPALGPDPGIFLVLLIVVAIPIFISENIPRIISASMIFISFASNYGALGNLLGPKAHPGEMFWAWLAGGIFMSLGIIYGLWVLQKINLIKVPADTGSQSVAG